MEKTYKLYHKDVMCGSTAVFFSAIYNMPGKEKEKKAYLEKTLVDLLNLDVIFLLFFLYN